MSVQLQVLRTQSGSKTSPHPQGAPVVLCGGGACRKRTVRCWTRRKGRQCEGNRAKACMWHYDVGVLEMSRDLHGVWEQVPGDEPGVWKAYMEGCRWSRSCQCGEWWELRPKRQWGAKAWGSCRKRRRRSTPREVGRPQSTWSQEPWVPSDLRYTCVTLVAMGRVVSRMWWQGRPSGWLPRSEGTVAWTRWSAWWDLELLGTKWERKWPPRKAEPLSDYASFPHFPLPRFDALTEPRLSVAPEVDIMDYCKKEWRGNTQKAICMKKVCRLDAWISSLANSLS